MNQIIFIERVRMRISDVKFKSFTLFLYIGDCSISQ